MKIWDALFRRARQADNEAAKAIDVADSEKGRQVLEDSKKQIASFESQISGLMASKKLKEKQLKPLQDNITKFEGIATKAGAAGNADDVRAAAAEIVKFRGQLDSLKSEIEKDSALEAKLRKQLSDARDKIARSEAKADSLKVRQESAQIRKALASNSVDQAGSALAQLDEWEKKVDRAEAEAEAVEELAGSGDVVQSLADKYGSQNAAVDAEMARFMKPATNP